MEVGSQQVLSLVQHLNQAGPAVPACQPTRRRTQLPAAPQCVPQDWGLTPGLVQPSRHWVLSQQVALQSTHLGPVSLPDEHSLLSLLSLTAPSSTAGKQSCQAGSNAASSEHAQLSWPTQISKPSLGCPTHIILLGAREVCCITEQLWGLTAAICSAIVPTVPTATPEANSCGETPVKPHTRHSGPLNPRENR